jgi:hypothetical protein
MSRHPEKQPRLETQTYILNFNAVDSLTQYITVGFDVKSFDLKTFCYNNLSGSADNVLLLTTDLMPNTSPVLYALPGITGSSTNYSFTSPSIKFHYVAPVRVDNTYTFRLTKYDGSVISNKASISLIMVLQIEFSNDSSKLF